MSAIAKAIRAAERAPLPDAILRLAIDALVGSTKSRLSRADSLETARFATEMSSYPIATHVADANAQHYEVPAEFFELVLGPQRKYSCCLYTDADTTLAQAEENALSETAVHADLRDGQTVLELGCGWGSLTLWMARRFPASRIVAVSNSQSQRQHILREARSRNLDNLEVVTADMNGFDPGRRFDRVVSVEMFEHMSNWPALLKRIHGWIAPGGLLFVHVFAHRTTPYRFDPANGSDWIAQHFFTGGVMPSRALMRQFPDLFSVEREWWWNGTHYARTANDWLVRHAANACEIRAIFARTYGKDAQLWQKRWRLFFLATAGLFGHSDGEEWGIAHYLLKPGTC